MEVPTPCVAPDPGSAIARSLEYAVDLQLTTCEVAGRTVVAVAGEVDVATAGDLREHLVQLIAEGHHHLVIDLAGVGFLDSAGLAVLLEVLERVGARDGSLRLVCTREPILKIVRITGVDQVFPFYGDVFAAALAAAGAGVDLVMTDLATQQRDPAAEQQGAGVA